MRNKRIMAMSMALLLALQSPLTSVSVNATQVGEESTDTTEYVVQVDNDKEFQNVVEDNEDVVVKDESVTELEEENIVILELTDEEAKELEKDKNIVLEENVLFCANTTESSEATEEEETTAATITEEANNVETISTESLTEETVDATKDEISEEPVTQESTTQEEKKVTKEKEDSKKKAEKDKKEKHDKKDKKKEKQDKEREEKRARIQDKKNRATSETQQWNLEAVHHTDNVEKNDTIKVALLDSGVSFDEDVPVVDRITINEKNEVENALFDDATGHGTSMAGIIAAQDDGDGIRGINPDADIYSIQVLDENNQSTLGQVIAGIHQAIALDCDIINMSFGTTVDSQLLHDAIKEADKNGILMIAAAGNTKGGSVEYPAAYDEVLAVGASDTSGNKLDGSSDGEEIEIFAPGDQVVSTGLFGGNIVLSGTSIAAAQVTGAASLLWSINQEKEAGFIRSLMTNTAQSMEDNGVSEAGLLDIENAIEHYDTLEYTFKENVSEYEELQEDAREAEEFLDVKLVNGMWGGGKHANMAKAATEDYNIDDDYVSLMQRAARLADYDDYKGAGALHGKKNYVKTLKFLYNCAGYLRKGKGVDKAVKTASSDAGLDTSQKSDSLLVEKVRLLLSEDILSNISESSSKARYFKVMGFAMHVAGDTYAHRTIVPAYTIKGTNPLQKIESASATSETSRFGSDDFVKGLHLAESDATLKTWAFNSTERKEIKTCRIWECFQRTVELGVVEFRDIKHFSINTVGAGAYEDNANFCRERFEEAEYVCYVLFTDSYENYKFDGVYILFPTEKNLKLNNFKNFAKEAGEDISVLTSKEWTQMSTPKEY